MPAHTSRSFMVTKSSHCAGLSRSHHQGTRGHLAARLVHGLMIPPQKLAQERSHAHWNRFERAAVTRAGVANHPSAAPTYHPSRQLLAGRHKLSLALRMTYLAVLIPRDSFRCSGCVDGWRDHGIGTSCH